MLRTNSKALRDKIKKHIQDNYNPDGYDLPPADDFPTIAQQILNTFRREKQYTKPYMSERLNFSDWCYGLPSILCCDFLLGDTRGYVADLLEQTPQQAAKYSDERASDFMIVLIYDELRRAEDEFSAKC